MCMEDIRIMRATGVGSNDVTVPAATPTSVILQNNNRVSVVVCVLGSGTVTLSIGTDAPSETMGFQLDPTQRYLFIELQKHGALVQQPLTAWSTAGCNLYVTETYLEKQ